MLLLSVELLRLICSFHIQILLSAQMYYKNESSEQFTQSKALRFNLKKLVIPIIEPSPA